MLRKTLFILGAGTGVEIDLPDGRALADNIRRSLNISVEEFSPKVSSGSQRIANALRLAGGSNINSLRHAAMEISAGIPFANSIDTLLESHKSNPLSQLCGKLGIAREILRAERASALYINPNRNAYEPLSFPRLKDCWIIKLMRSLSEGVTKETLATIFDRISFVNFNYDRCVEHFFYNAIQARFAATPDQAMQTMASLNIIHPYGTIGLLPWQDNNSSIEFGSDQFEASNLVAIAKRIQTFTEGVADEKLLHKIQKAISEAELIVFLGFAYHRQNMQLLTVGRDAEAPPIRTLGTVLGFSSSDQEIIKTSISAAFGRPWPDNQIELVSTKCADLLDSYRRTFFQ